MFKNESFKYAFFLVIEVKESELFHFVYLEAFYAVHYILFTDLGLTVVNDTSDALFPSILFFLWNPARVLKGEKKKK